MAKRFKDLFYHQLDPDTTASGVLIPGAPPIKKQSLMMIAILKDIC